jgi:hypothetical protein
MICWIVYVVFSQRTRQQAMRSELHAKLLDRVGSAREFGEFLSSESGQRFLASLAPVEQTDRVWRSIRVGSFLILFAVIVLLADFAHVLNAELREFTTVGWLSLAVGVAMLGSAAISMMVARRFDAKPPTGPISPVQ